jgi:predicted nucleic acid-binding protein
MILYLDANIVIYVVEKDPVWGPKAKLRITAAQAAGDMLATSDASRLECLVGPFILGDPGILADYTAFFADPLVQVLPLTATTCERAARIRASHNFKPLDALHLAAAAEHGCGRFLTNDAGLKSFPDITVEVLT